MPRVRKGAARSRKHKRILRATRGQIGAASRRYHVAREAWLRAGQHATIGRKLRKRDFRRLWITRISAACRQRGLNYSAFIHGLSLQQVTVNRKMLAETAVADPGAFDALVRIARSEAPPAPQAKPPVVEDKTPEVKPKPPAKKKAAPAKKAAPKKAAVPVKRAAAKKTTKKAAAPVKKPAAKKTTKKAAPARTKAAPAAKKRAAKKPAAKKPRPGQSAEK